MNLQTFGLLNGQGQSLLKIGKHFLQTTKPLTLPDNAQRTTFSPSDKFEPVQAPTTI